LLDAKAQVLYSYQYFEGWHALHFATYHGHRETCAVLLKAKAQIDARTAKGVTPLMYAATKGHSEVVKFLLAAKACVNPICDYGESALSRAHHDVRSLLLDAKATITASAFVGAAFRGDEQACRVLLEAKACVNARSYVYGGSALKAATEHNRVSVCALLLAAHANPNVVAKSGCHSGNSVLAIAAWRGRGQLVKLLMQANANASLQSTPGRTALHRAALAGHRDVCALLLQATNAETLLAIKTNKGSTALRHAKCEKHATTVQLLRNWRGAAAFDAQTRAYWHTAPPQGQYSWAQSRLFDVHLINEITSFLL
jgi:ankyrin repeat protein